MILNHFTRIELRKGRLGELTRDGDITQLKVDEVYVTRGVLPLDGKFVVVVSDREGKLWVCQTDRQPPSVFQRTADAANPYAPYPPQTSPASQAAMAPSSAASSPATTG